MSRKTIKNRQLEKSLSQLGTFAADATDELMQANKATKAISDKLVLIQKEIEQIYITLEEPLDIVDK